MADEIKIKIFNKKSLRMTVLPDIEQFMHWLTQFSINVEETVESLLMYERIKFQPDGTNYEAYLAA